MSDQPDKFDAAVSQFMAGLTLLDEASGETAAGLNDLLDICEDSSDAYCRTIIAYQPHLNAIGSARRRLAVYISALGRLEKLVSK